MQASWEVFAVTSSLQPILVLVVAASCLLLTACVNVTPTGTQATATPRPAGTIAATSVPATRAATAATAPAAATAPPATSPAAQQPAGVTSDREAVEELAATRQGYEQAQQAFNRGDKDAALELMNTAYLEHFERVEPYLDRRISQDYREQVEAAISRNLRRRLRDGAPDAEITAQFPVGLQALAEAEQRLASGG